MHGTAETPRLVVNRSNQYIYAQLIDDVKGNTLAATATVGKVEAGKKMTKTEQAFSAGETLAKKAAEKGIKAVVFDRRASKFHGRVKSFALGMQKGGIKI